MLQTKFRLLFYLSFLIILSCNQTTEKGSDSIEFRKYYTKGEQLYIKHCQNCHQKAGTGLGRLYPPLAQSDYLNEDSARVVCLIRYGLQGSIHVNGNEYNMVMKGNPLLDDLEIAEITTYIYNTWGNNKGLFPVKQVTALLDSCKSRY